MFWMAIAFWDGWLGFGFRYGTGNAHRQNALGLHWGRYRIMGYVMVLPGVFHCNGAWFPFVSGASAPMAFPTNTPTPPH